MVKKVLPGLFAAAWCFFVGSLDLVCMVAGSVFLGFFVFMICGDSCEATCDWDGE